MKKTLCFALIITFLLVAATRLKGDNSSTGSAEPVKILLLMDDNLGSSYEVAVGKVKSIKAQLDDFGWELTEAGMKRELLPCPWGVENYNTQPYKTDILVDDIESLEEYHALIILPGRDHKNLLQSPKTSVLIREAVELGMPVAAWCQGVRLLAAADVIRGKRVIGNFQHLQEYKDAGALAVEYSVEEVDGKRVFKNISPPIIDGNIITTVRSLYYRDQMCQLIKNAVDIYLQKKYLHSLLL